MPRDRTWILAAVCGIVLAGSCVLWALLVKGVGTDVCTLPRVPRRAGPVACHRHRHLPQARFRPRYGYRVWVLVRRGDRWRVMS